MLPDRMVYIAHGVILTPTFTFSCHRSQECVLAYITCLCPTGPSQLGRSVYWYYHLPASHRSVSSRQECVLGLEFSGRDRSGRRVMGLVPARGLATTVSADPEFLWPVPPAWTLEEAASVPVVYATAYYALVVRGRLQPGQSVLIHSGQSAATVCRQSQPSHMATTCQSTSEYSDTRLVIVYWLLNWHA